jgi:hypothetical protein
MPKTYLTYKDDEDLYKVESVWARVEGNYFRIDNIPFFAPNIAYNDLVSAELEDGGLQYEKMIEPSGHSTIQLVIADGRSQLETGYDFEELGCS